MSPLKPHEERSQAAIISQRFRLSKPAAALLTAEHTPSEFAITLLEHRHFNDAIRFIAHALTARDGIWWGCQCARRSVTSETTPEEEAALAAAERWVTEMSDESRRSAFVAANAAGIGTAAGSVALAVFYSGGSLAPPDAPPVAPDEFASASLVAGCIILATIHPDLAKIAELRNTYIRQGATFLTGTAV